MTVSVVSHKIIKISLTHTEVIACFGEYEKILNLSPKTRIRLTLLINDIISENPSFSETDKISAKIQLVKNKGCVITLTSLLPENKDNLSECLFEFSGADSMTDAITTLYKMGAYHKILSHLYKTDTKYHLIVNCINPKEKFFLLHEFCSKISDSAQDIEYVREYGKPLILNYAIKIYGEAFLKRLH